MSTQNIVCSNDGCYAVFFENAYGNYRAVVYKKNLGNNKEEIYCVFHGEKIEAIIKEEKWKPCLGIPPFKKVTQTAQKLFSEITFQDATKIVEEVNDEKRNVEVIFKRDILGNLTIISKIVIRDLKTSEVR